MNCREGSRGARGLIVVLCVLAPVAALRADAIDDSAALQGVFDEALLDIHGGRWSPAIDESLQQARNQFAQVLSDPAARELWNAPLPVSVEGVLPAAAALGFMQARLQHVAALEMISSQRSGNIDAAREWRSVIKLPKFASSVEGALALQRLGASPTQRAEVSRLLAKEYVIWQITRAREKADALMRLIHEGRATPELIYARASEIHGLSNLPGSLLKLATGATPLPNLQSESDFAAFLAAGRENSSSIPKVAARWRLSLEAGYPNLLSAEDVERRERIVLKLMRLIPKEYQSGVRDGEVTIPIEYREAKSFTIQTRQIVNELMPVWRQTKAPALEKNGPELLAAIEGLEGAIGRKAAQSEVDDFVAKASNLLQHDFGLTLKRAGMGSDVVAETSLEVRSLLGQSLAAAQNKLWRKAEQLRLDAYINFDLEIESRTLPRDPALAIRAEKSFLDGQHGQPGVKAALDARLTGEELAGSYQRALDALEECAALVKVGLSPTAAMVGAIFIVAREGLEAVVILAALLAGLRGAENAGIRKRIGIGAWLALGVTAIIFVASRTLLQGLSHYGETLEAVISVLAVVILLMVTNWVFHKYYWTGWNARLRDLSKAAQRQQQTRWESLALVGVGFMTIFREGFETTLFMQSLILEAGMRPVLLGLALGGLFIGAVGFAVFSIGAKLPYRKMLVVTGGLVIFVLFTFIGSTVRLFQTVGWLPVHPVPGLELPAWMGVWFGLYPTWEGLLIPFGTFAYVGGMWLFVKVSVKRAQQREARLGSSTPLAA
ncbi:MAG TPA: FTR1 family protein [Terrimicrobiaceae bacterium]